MPLLDQFSSGGLVGPTRYTTPPSTPALGRFITPPTALQGGRFTTPPTPLGGGRFVTPPTPVGPTVLTSRRTVFMGVPMNKSQRRQIALQAHLADEADAARLRVSRPRYVSLDPESGNKPQWTTAEQLQRQDAGFPRRVVAFQFDVTLPRNKTGVSRIALGVDTEGRLLPTEDLDQFLAQATPAMRRRLERVAKGVGRFAAHWRPVPGTNAPSFSGTYDITGAPRERTLQGFDPVRGVRAPKQIHAVRRGYAVDDLLKEVFHRVPLSGLGGP